MPLAQVWSTERVRRLAVLDRRFTATTPEVLFVDRAGATRAPLAAALLAGQARGLVQVSSAGPVTPRTAGDERPIERRTQPSP